MMIERLCECRRAEPGGDVTYRVSAIVTAYGPSLAPAMVMSETYTMAAEEILYSRIPVRDVVEKLEGRFARALGLTTFDELVERVLATQAERDEARKAMR